MGGVSRQKGTLTLLRALDALPASRAVLLLAGAREEAIPALERSEIATRLQRLGASGRVRILGRVIDTAPCFAAADTVVFCPPEPHQGRPIVEAATMSRPVIASDFDCVREFVTHGRNGWLVRPGDHADLSAAIAAVLADRPRARAMGRENHLVALARHDPTRNGARVNAFYERVLGGRQQA